MAGLNDRYKSIDRCTGAQSAEGLNRVIPDIEIGVIESMNQGRYGPDASLYPQCERGIDAEIGLRIREEARQGTGQIDAGATRRQSPH